MESIKPARPDSFEGKRNALTVAAWLYQVETYLNLMALTNPTLNVTDEIRIQFATTLMKKNAANWWYMQVKAGNTPTTWSEFKNRVRTEFIPQDTQRRQRDKLRELVQTKSVSSYLESFRNIIISISDLSEAEKLDKFVSGLKPMIRLEVLKAGCNNIDDASRVALNVDSAYYGSGIFLGNSVPSSESSGPQPMDIGNVEGGPHYRGKSFKGKKKKGFKLSQRARDIENGTCFVCHKKGCWSSNHYDGNKKISNNNSQVESENSEQEN